jgi:hypothetical protein
MLGAFARAVPFGGSLASQSLVEVLLKTLEPAVTTLASVARLSMGKLEEAQSRSAFSTM